MGEHVRLYQHVHLDHGGQSPSDGPVRLADLEKAHRAQHINRRFEHCEPHSASDIPVRTYEQAVLNDLRDHPTARSLNLTASTREAKP
ncbi:MAG: hypothetical protein KGL39_29900 [Patescibacteria group bacterium]|nr:hypothetical protein [Patescibacteria group bacterium]